MNDFKKYMDQVKADPALKSRTAEYIRSAQEGKSDKELFVKSKKEPYSMKKGFIAVAAVAACAVLSIGGYAFYQTPVNYVSLDINPSVELGVNAFQVVVRVQAMNEDGQTIAEDLDLTNRGLKNAVRRLVEAATVKGFVADDGSTVISVTSESDDEEKSKDLQKAGEKGATEALEEKKINAVVYTNAASLELRTEAKDAGISPGKYKMIKLLQVLDPTIKVEDYADAKMTILIEKANELLSSSDNLEKQIEEIQQTFAKMKDTAEKVQKNRDNGKGNQEQEEEQSQTKPGPASQANSIAQDKASNPGPASQANSNAQNKKPKTSSTSSVSSEQQSSETSSIAEQNQSGNKNSKAAAGGNGNGKNG